MKGVIAMALVACVSVTSAYLAGAHDGARAAREQCAADMAALAPRQEGNGDFFRGPLQPERGNRRF